MSEPSLTPEEEREADERAKRIRPVYDAANEAVDLLRLGDSYTGYAMAPLVACMREGWPDDDMAWVLTGMDAIDLAVLATEALDWIARVPFAPDPPS